MGRGSNDAECFGENLDSDQAQSPEFEPNRDK